MNPLVVLGGLGVGITKLVDVVRTAFDKQDRVPKAYWLLLAQGLGIAAAFGIAHSPQALHYLGLPVDPSVFGTLVAGIGLGGVSSFGHELLSALSAVSGTAPTPKGLKMAKTPAQHDAEVAALQAKLDAVKNAAG